MAIKWKKVNEHQKFLPDDYGFWFGPIASGNNTCLVRQIVYILCEGISDRECEEIAAIEVIGERGTRMYCKDHANAMRTEFPGLGLPRKFS